MVVRAERKEETFALKCLNILSLNHFESELTFIVTIFLLMLKTGLFLRQVKALQQRMV